MILGLRAVTRRRYAAETFDSNGRPVRTSTDATIRASVQPASDDDMRTLPEGERSRQAVKLFTTSELKVASQHDGTAADRVVVDAVVYEVRAVQRWRDLMPHYEAVAVRLQELEP
jgi:hypothetical protein